MIHYWQGDQDRSHLKTSTALIVVWILVKLGILTFDAKMKSLSDRYILSAIYVEVYLVTEAQFLMPLCALPAKREGTARLRLAIIHERHH